MSDILDLLLKDPSNALRTIKPTNPILKDIFYAIPEEERKGVQPPERGHALKLWLEQWATERMNRGGSTSSISEPQQQQQQQQNQQQAREDEYQQQQYQQQQQQQQYQQPPPQQQPPQQYNPPAQQYNQQEQYQPQQQQQQYQQQQQQQQYQPQQSQSYQQHQHHPQQAQYDDNSQAPPLNSFGHPVVGDACVDDFSPSVPSRCLQCRKKDLTIKKLSALVTNLLEQLDDVALTARGDLSLILSAATQQG